MSANTLGRYHIIRELARSNDIVYEAMDPALGRKIALKELQVAPNLTGKARHDRIQRFTREARAAAGLHHPNIVRIHEHGQADGRYFIAMEFLDGQSLRDVLRQRGALPAQEALRIAAAVADALEYAHRHGVVHRDVKPDNVHLEPDGRVVITDFGIARLTFEPSLTADGQIFGTPSYMSPEQVKGGDLDKRSDIFSLGVMLYEMLSGRKPFTGDSVITITYNIMNADPPPLTGPQGVDAIIRCALAKDMRYRYPSAAQMAEDIRSLAQGQPARRALAISPPGSGVRVGTAASLGAPVPVSRAPAPRAAAPAAIAPVVQPGPAGAGVPVSPRPYVNGGVAPRGAIPRPSPTPAAPVGYVAAPPRRAPKSSSNVGWLLAWAGVAGVIGLLILVLVWSFVTAYDRSRQNQASVRVDQVRQAADRSFAAKRYQEALNGYRLVAEQSTGREQVIARRNAAITANALAVEKMNAGDYDAAERYCREALLQDPATIEAEVTLGSISDRRGGRVDEAVEHYDRAIAMRAQALAAGIDPKIVDEQVKEAAEFKSLVLLREGRRLAGQGQTQQAELRFRGAVGAAPDCKWAREAKDELRSLGIDWDSPPSTTGPATGTTAPPASGVGGEPQVLTPGTDANTPASPGPGYGPAAPAKPPGWGPDVNLPGVGGGSSGPAYPPFGR